ncbi:hypothetical protein RUND412_008842 [Rhizina undulata]
MENYQYITDVDSRIRKYRKNEKRSSEENTRRSRESSLEDGEVSERVAGVLDARKEMEESRRVRREERGEREEREKAEKYERLQNMHEKLKRGATKLKNSISHQKPAEESPASTKKTLHNISPGSCSDVDYIDDKEQSSSPPSEHDIGSPNFPTGGEPFYKGPYYDSQRSQRIYCGGGGEDLDVAPYDPERHG